MQKKLKKDDNNHEKEKANTVREKREIQNLKVSISEQIKSVSQNIQMLQAADNEWQEKRVLTGEHIKRVRDQSLTAFFRWLNMSPALQVCTQSESDAMLSIVAVSDLQGLVGQWGSLRSVVSEIQVGIIVFIFIFAVRMDG